ncbi:hypothetical protein O6H91_02G038700 [Diphasiastrum complanatum]|uniref:Uncharacterized protein n=1 Tax=Diphasiastrum complanatum TaxID=34168 RepID=A0ACC2EE70_DIPCM|nr:hypothetical protein O6H91_02G038700 [Diphasiastrum complanatum]
MRNERESLSQSKAHELYRLRLTPDSIILEWSANADSSPGLCFCGVPVSSSDSCAAESSSAVQMSSVHSGMVRKESYQSLASQGKARKISMDDFFLSRNISSYYNDVCNSSKHLNMHDMKIYDSSRLRLPVLYSSSNACSGPIVSLAEPQHGMRGAHTWSKFLEAANAAGRLSIQLSNGCMDLVAASSETESTEFAFKSLAAVPFKWEEAPGKPKSCYNLNIQAHDLSLKPPPRLLAAETRKKSSNPLKHNGRRGLLNFLTGRRSPRQDREKVRDNPLFLHQFANPKAGSIASSISRPSTYSDRNHTFNLEAPTTQRQGICSDQSHSNAAAASKDLPSLQKNMSVREGDGAPTSSCKSWLRGRQHKENKPVINSTPQGLSYHAEPSAPTLLTHEQSRMHYVPDVSPKMATAKVELGNDPQLTEKFVMGEESFAYPFSRSSSCSSNFAQKDAGIANKPITPHHHLRSTVHQVIKYFTLSLGKQTYRKDQLHGKYL